MQGKKYNVHNIIQLGGSIFLKDLIFNFFFNGLWFREKIYYKFKSFLLRSQIIFNEKFEMEY